MKHEKIYDPLKVKVPPPIEKIHESKDITLEPIDDNLFDAENLNPNIVKKDDEFNDFFQKPEVQKLNPEFLNSLKEELKSIKKVDYSAPTDKKKVDPRMKFLKK